MVAVEVGYDDRGYLVGGNAFALHVGGEQTPFGIVEGVVSFSEAGIHQGDVIPYPYDERAYVHPDQAIRRKLVGVGIPLGRLNRGKEVGWGEVYVAVGYGDNLGVSDG